ncbi:hypothetical protein PAMP_001413 [Pampus punctatissimus]
MMPQSLSRPHPLRLKQADRREMGKFLDPLLLTAGPCGIWFQANDVTCEHSDHGSDVTPEVCVMPGCVGCCLETANLCMPLVIVCRSSSTAEIWFLDQIHLLFRYSSDVAPAEDLPERPDCP